MADEFFIDWRAHAATQSDKFYKTTLWRGAQMMTGLNCLAPGQTQKVHAHEGADKLYFVLEGSGQFTIGDETRAAVAGMLVIAPAGVPHGVANEGAERLTLLIAIAPRPK